MSPDELSVVLRALAFAALFQAAGATLFLAVFRRDLPLTANWLRRLSLHSALAGIVLTLAQQSVEAARMADGFGGLLNRQLLQLAWTSGNAMSHQTAIGGLAALALAHCRRQRPLLGVALVGALLAVLSPLLTGHTSIHALRWALAPLLALHLLVVAFWFGALLPLHRITQRESATDAARIMGRFSALAGRTVPLIAVAGLGMTLLLVPGFGVLQQPYGKILLAKLSVFALLMLLASYNKWRLTPALIEGALGAAAQLRRNVSLEYGLLLLVLTLTAALTTFYSPGV